jgi:hypothetical protein
MPPVKTQPPWNVVDSKRGVVVVVVVIGVVIVGTVEGIVVEVESSKDVAFLLLLVEEEGWSSLLALYKQGTKEKEE